MGKHYYTLGVTALVFIITAGLLPSSVFAQQDDSQQSNATGTDTLFGQSPVQTDDTSTGLNVTSTDVPVLQQVSEKGIYRVELKWPQTISDVEDALQVPDLLDQRDLVPELRKGRDKGKPLSIDVRGISAGASCSSIVTRDRVRLSTRTPPPFAPGSCTSAVKR